MKAYLRTILAAALLAPCAGRAAAALTAAGAYALDGSGNQQTTFTNVETIALRQAVTNSAASESMIRFVFTIYNPSGGAVFRHEGNSARATLGASHSQLAGLAISRFYSAPGLYRFRGEATLDGQTVTQEATFQISSPNINLIYPPNGAAGLNDKPMVFRWVASGASTYRITVGELGGQYAPHEGTATGPMYSYPDAPANDWEKLANNVTYRWKVEGLDATGVKIAESNYYTFSLKAQSSSSSRNVMVESLELIGGGADFAQEMQFRAVVKNTGGTNENNISLKMSLSGMPAGDSPKEITMLAAGAREDRTFKAFMPPGQAEGLAVACVDIFDDNIPDNCKTRLISQASAQGAGAGGGDTRTLSYQQIWDALMEKLGPEVKQSLEGYTFDSIECANCAAGELNDVMLSLLDGSADLTGAAVAESYSPAGAAALPVQPEPEKAEAEEEEKPEMDLELLAPDKQKDSEWSGYTASVKSKTPVFYTIKSRKTWKKVWELISTDEAPEVNFREKMVVGVIAGTDNKADTVRILARRQEGEKTLFDYYMIEKSGENQAVPYIFKSVDTADGKIEFKRLDKGR